MTVKKKTDRSSVHSAAMKCGGKVGKSKKQKLANGGEVLLQSFDYNTLTPDEKLAYDKLTPEQQTQVRSKFDAQGNSSALQSGEEFDNSTLSSAGTIGGIISLVSEGAGVIAGEENEYGQSGSQVEAVFEGISDIGSNIDAAQYYQEQGNDFYAVGATLLPGFSEIQYQEDVAKDIKSKENKEKLSSAFYKKRAETKFQDGGKISNEISSEDILQSIIGKIPTESPEGKIAIPEGYVEKPYGTDPNTGDILTRVEKKSQPKQEAKLTSKVWRTQTVDNTKQILNLFYGGEEGYNPEDPDSIDKLISGGKRRLTSDKQGFKDEDVFRVTNDSLGNYVLERNTIDPRTEQELNNGGEISGQGSGKSDSISADLPEGSYIVPADAPEAAVNRLKKYMNYDEANLNKESGKSVKVSDGEIYIPPQDVPKANSFLQRLGYDNGLDEMAPNAKFKLSDNPNYYADGGQIGDYLSESAGFIGGTGQLLLSAIEAGKSDEPKSNTEQLLRNLSNEVRLRAEYGLNPYERTEAENHIERTFAAEREIINNASGGSLDVIMNNTAAAAMRMNRSKLSLETTSAKLREEKQRYADKIGMEAIKANDKDFARKYAKYSADQENISNLIDSGISNIIGQGQFNKYTDALNEEKAKNEQSSFINIGNQDKKEVPKSAVEEIVTQTTDFTRFNKL